MGAVAVGAPPRTPGRLRLKKVDGGSALPPRPPPERGLGRSSSEGLGAEPPATLLRRSRPGVWGGAPTAAAPLAPLLWLRHR